MIQQLDKIAGYLISRETITGKEFMKIFRAVEKGLEIPENLDDLPDEDVKAEEKSEEKTEMKTENIEAVRDPEVTGVQEETLNTGDATISDDVVADETDNHVSDSEE